jgi:phosphoribosylaminoimidazolecarboxamide formyltransferase/IMP cyclohydrolase
LIVTAGARDVLRAGQVDCVDLDAFLGMDATFPFPPTLHPEMEHAITGESPKRIDLVYDTPYPVSEGLDIGGHALLAFAVKGDRTPVFEPGELPRLGAQIASLGTVSAAYRRELQERALGAIADYYAALHASMFGSAGPSSNVGAVHRLLREGENPYQVPAHWLRTSGDDPLALHAFEQVRGPTPCFTNLADFDAVIHVLALLASALGAGHSICIGAKHGSPVGIGVDSDPERALRAALWGNPVAIWGGELITNFEIDETLAAVMFEDARRGEQYGSARWMLDVIAAPHFDRGAVQVLQKRAFSQLYQNEALREPTLEGGTRDRVVRGGVVRQPTPTYVMREGDIEWGAGARGPFEDLAIAWAAAYGSNVGGNEVAIAKEGKLLAVGGGPSTVAAATTAVERAKAHHDVAGASFVADAFFPFEDAPDVLVQAGCKYGLAPAGGKRQAMVQEHLAAREVTFGLLPAEARGFCRH